MGSSTIVWQDPFDNGMQLPQDTIIDVWRTPWTDEMGNVTDAGYSAILSAPWYLVRCGAVGSFVCALT